MADNDKKYYWLKLQRDFFKRHDIRIIEEMPNGKDYILFYLKLLCESIDHNGNLRFSETIPYNENMLSTITCTNIDIVRSAIKVFLQLDMLEILDDGTIFIAEVQKMIGSAANNDNANRQRKFRERQKLKELPERYENVTKNNESKSIDIDKDIDKEIEKEKGDKSKRFTPPTLEEVKNYCLERNNKVNAENFIDFYSSKGWYIGKNKMKDWKAAVRTWENRDKKETPTQKPEKANNNVYHNYKHSNYDFDELEKELKEPNKERLKGYADYNDLDELEREVRKPKSERAAEPPINEFNNINP